MSALNFDTIEEVAEETTSNVSDNIAEDLVYLSRGNVIDGGECLTCKNEYKNLMMHWARSDCEHPTIGDNAIEVVKGMLMGDGALRHRGENRNSHLQVSMINKDFLNWLDGQLSWISRGVSHHETAKAIADRARDSGFSPTAKEDNYHDSWMLCTIHHPAFNQFRGWYGDEGKEFPDNLSLTQLALKYWYVCDGYLSWGNERGQPTARISSHQAHERAPYFKKLFKECGYSVEISGKTIMLHVDGTNEFFERSPYAPPGFEYKWETESRERYSHMKNVAYGDI